MKALILLLMIALFGSFSNSFAQVYINEFMASNATTLDNTGDTSDWIELYNGGSNSVNLQGYYLSDDFGLLTKYQLPVGNSQYIIPAGGFLLLWASSLPSRGAKHLGFSLSSIGEKIVLTAPNGTSIVDSMSFSNQRTDVSFGRLPNGGITRKFFSPASSNASNVSANAYSGFVVSPTFSVQSGYFQNAFSLTITCLEPNSVIYYTIDGSEPSNTNTSGTSFSYKNQYPENPGQSAGANLTKTFQTLQYSDPLSITDRSSLPNKIADISSTYHQTPNYLPTTPIYKGTVIRVKAYAPNKLPSNIESRTYFFTPNGLPKSTLPAFSIKTNANKLFDYNNGMYVAGTDFVAWRTANPTLPAYAVPVGNYYRETEIPANVEYIENGIPILNQEVGLRVHGAGTRIWDKKSLRLYSTGENASKSDMNYAFFPGSPLNSFKRIILRNSGNDYERTLMKDGTIQQMAKRLNLEIQEYRPSILFLNGEYWGIHNIRERLDEYYYASHYGIDKDSVEFFSDPDIDGDTGHYLITSNFIKNNSMTITANYNYTKTRIDVDNFIDYSIMELYAANYDWPRGNITYWRKKITYDPNALKGKDGRWRWSLIDLDQSFEEFNENYFSRALTAPDFLLQYLLPNQSFKNQFINRYADLINTQFQPQILINHINNSKNTISAEIYENITRWTRPSSHSTWESNVNLMVAFANNRPAIVRQHIISQFSLTGIANLTVNVSDASQGYVKVNSVDILPTTIGVNSTPYPWTGTYFKGVPFNITAIPNRGYKFVRWEEGSTIILTPTIAVNLSTARSLKAVFEGDVNFNSIPNSYPLSTCNYEFLEWNPANPVGTYPANTKFVYMVDSDPTLSSNIDNWTNGAYNFISKTRINGLNSGGISLINTSNITTPNVGYPGLKLGGILLGLQTLGVNEAKIQWTGGTVTPNTRQYNIRLQYREGDTGIFTDLLDNLGNPVEYVRNATAGHSQTFGPISLPAAILNKPYVQLFWRYYYNGIGITNARDELRIDDIIITRGKCESALSGQWQNSATWNCGRIPTVCDDVVIKNGHIVTLDGIDSHVKNFMMENNSQLLYTVPTVFKMNH